MDRIIEVRVNGTYVEKDGMYAGTQGEVNATALRIEFDDGWDGFAKTVTWWDAKGENPTSRVLTADLLEDMQASTRIYLCPIPGEAMAIWGKCTFAIDGYLNGRRQRSAYGTLVVQQGGNGMDVHISTPTPSQIEQLQVQIDTLLGDMQERAVRAETAAEAAEESENNAKQSEDNAKASEVNAKQSEDRAAVSAKDAAAYANKAKQIAGGDFLTESEMQRQLETTVKKAGDTMTGDLAIEKDVAKLSLGKGAQAILQKNANEANDFGTEIIDRKKDGILFAKLVIDAADEGGRLKLVLSDGNVFYLYHEGHKPEPQDIGAADEVAGLFQNDVRLKSGFCLLTGSDGDLRLESQSAPYDSMNARALSIRNHTGSSLENAVVLVTKNPTDGNAHYSMYGEHNPPKEVGIEVDVGTNWQDTGEYYVQSVLAEGLRASDCPGVTLAMSESRATDDAWEEALDYVRFTEAGDDELILHSTKPTQTAYKLIVKVVR